MKIISANKKCCLSITPQGDGAGYSSFEIEVLITLGCSSFHTKHSDMQLLRIAQFAENLDRFVTDRSLTPSLEGIYDSHLTFRTAGPHVKLEFLIGDRITGDPTCYGINGAFEIDQSYLNEYVAGFRNLSLSV